MKRKTQRFFTLLILLFGPVAPLILTVWQKAVFYPEDNLNAGSGIMLVSAPKPMPASSGFKQRPMNMEIIINHWLRLPWIMVIMISPTLSMISKNFQAITPGLIFQVKWRVLAGVMRLIKMLHFSKNIECIRQKFTSKKEYHGS